MAKFFSDDAAKRIVDAVKGFENPSTNQTSAMPPNIPIGGVKLGKVPVFYGDEREPITEEDQVYQFIYVEGFVFDEETSPTSDDPEKIGKIKPAPGGNNNGGLGVGRTYFMYPPQKGRHYPVVNMGGQQFALQGEIFPVVMSRTGGSHGNHAEQCSLTYTVQTCFWDQLTTGIKVPEPYFILEREVDPSYDNTGHYRRTDYGRYKPATYGLATMYGGSTKRIYILWCNEVFDVVTCTSATPSAIRWGGLYDSSIEYEPNTMVIYMGDRWFVVNR